MNSTRPKPPNASRIRIPKTTIARILFSLFMGTATVATAAMYRWVDEHGATLYAEHPPAAADAVEIKKHAGPSEAEVQAAAERLRRQREQAFDEQEQRKAAAALEAEQTAAAQRRAGNCASARGNLQKYQDLGFRMIKTPDGRHQLLSEDEVRIKIELAEQQIKAFCD